MIVVSSPNAFSSATCLTIFGQGARGPWQQKQTTANMSQRKWGVLGVDECNSLSTAYIFAAMEPVQKAGTREILRFSSTDDVDDDPLGLSGRDATITTR